MTSEATYSPAGRWLAIIGIGEDGVAGLSETARSLITTAGFVIGGARHLALAADLVTSNAEVWPSPISGGLDMIDTHRGQPVVVLATGDPFHYGIGRSLVARFGADAIVAIPQPSAFSLAAARIGWSLQDTVQTSLHGRPLQSIVRHLQPGARILALSWDQNTPKKLAVDLCERGMGPSRLTVLSAMGGPHERTGTALASAFDLSNIDPLNTIAIEVECEPGARIVPLCQGLDDDLFEADGQLTKREIRAVTLSALAPRQGELLWDIGLGAGSVAIEWLLRHPSMCAIGIEQRLDRAARAARNAAALGTCDLQIVEEAAPGALAGLPAPDAVFIGGGMRVEGVFEAAWSALKPGGRLVANAVALETESKLIALHAQYGGNLIRIQIARAFEVGSMTGWRPAMPITQWTGVKP